MEALTLLLVFGFNGDLMTPQDILSQVAQSYIGTTDQETIDEFRRAITGRAMAQSWCLDFVWYCVKKVMAQQPKLLFALPESELVSFMWEHSPVSQKSLTPQRGWVAVWNKVGTISGHCGVVVDTLPGRQFMTVEGNTHRDGSPMAHCPIGVWAKTHSELTREHRVIGTLSLCGFVNPFA